MSSSTAASNRTAFESTVASVSANAFSKATTFVINSLTKSSSNALLEKFEDIKMFALT